jgi:hypothetical protein
MTPTGVSIDTWRPGNRHVLIQGHYLLPREHATGQPVIRCNDPNALIDTATIMLVLLSLYQIVLCM